MKKVFFATLVFILGLISTQTFAQKKENKMVCFKSNMHCESCQATLTEYLKFEKGVKDLKIDHVTNTIKIEYKADKNKEEQFKKAIEKKGYKADKITTEEYNKIAKEAEPVKNQDEK